MTQEQNKPVRSREDQANLILNISEAFALNQEAPTTEFVLGQLEEAEARGAAEQRRKDAEEQEVAYYIDHRPGSGSPPYAVRSLEQCAFPEKGEPVYTHPANVVALEGRIAELEGALKKADEFITNGIEFGYIRMPDRDTPDSAHETPRIVPRRPHARRNPIMTRTDTERLEWMANMSYHFENYGPRDDDPRCLMDQCGNRIGRKGTDIRKMIDSAMNAETP